MFSKPISTDHQPKPPIEWKLALLIGVLLGILAGLVSLFGKQWYSGIIPGGMMIASWVAVFRAKQRRFAAGFAASVLAGCLAWGLYMIVNFRELFPSGGSYSAVMGLTLAFLLPFIGIVSGFGSWIFSRSRERVLKAKKKQIVDKQKIQEEDEKEKQRQRNIYLNRPKRHRKKKK